MRGSDLLLLAGFGTAFTYFWTHGGVTHPGTDHHDDHHDHRVHVVTKPPVSREFDLVKGRDKAAPVDRH